MHCIAFGWRSLISFPSQKNAGLFGGNKVNKYLKNTTTSSSVSEVTLPSATAASRVPLKNSSAVRDETYAEESYEDESIELSSEEPTPRAARAPPSRSSLGTVREEEEVAGRSVRAEVPESPPTISRSASLTSRQAEAERSVGSTTRSTALSDSHNEISAQLSKGPSDTDSTGKKGFFASYSQELKKLFDDIKEQPESPRTETTEGSVPSSPMKSDRHRRESDEALSPRSTRGERTTSKTAAEERGRGEGEEGEGEESLPSPIRSPSPASSRSEEGRRRLDDDVRKPTEDLGRTLSTTDSPSVKSPRMVYSEDVDEQVSIVVALRHIFGDNSCLCCSAHIFLVYWL